MPKQANPEGGTRGESVQGATTSRGDRRPTPDQMYLASRLNRNEETQDMRNPIIEQKHQITAAALQKWNLVYGVAAVSDALRAAWGFPPEAGIENPYAYVAGILRGKP